VPELGTSKYNNFPETGHLSNLFSMRRLSDLNHAIAGERLEKGEGERGEGTEGEGEWHTADSTDDGAASVDKPKHSTEVAAVSGGVILSFRRQLPNASRGQRENKRRTRQLGWGICR